LKIETKFLFDLCIFILFSFGMLLWEIAFDVIPYRDWTYTNIIDHVKAGKRESIDFGPNPSEVQKDFAKIIRAGEIVII
jgi:hypothetical protein